MKDDARRMAREIAELKEAVRDLQTSARIGYTAIDNGALVVKDADGVVRQRIGRQTDGAYTVVDHNGITPPMPAPPVVLSGPISITVASYGNTVDNHDWPYDFEAIEAHVSTSPGFTPSAATKVGEFTTGGGSQIVRGEPDVPLYVVLVGRNTSGTLGVPSDEVSATPGKVVTDDDLAVIDEAMSGLTVRVTDTEASVDTLNATAEAITLDVSNIREVADGATSLAIGKSSITYSTVAPVDEPNVVGDLWFVLTGTEFTEVWRGLGGTAWEQAALNNSVIANLDAGKITSGFIAAARIATGTIIADMMAANSVTTEALVAEAVTADKVAANAITVGKIAAGAVTAGSLAADAITGKTITGGTITGATVIGGVLKTSETGNRVEVLPRIGNGEVHFYSDATPDEPSIVVGDGANDTISVFESLQLTPGVPAGGTGGVAAGLYLRHEAPVGGGLMTGHIELIATEVKVTSGEFGMSQILEDTWWINATLAGAWVNYANGFAPARYRRLNGIVYLDGLVRSGSGLIFTLPAGYRPYGGTAIHGAVDGTNAANARIDIATTGAVTLSAGNNGFVSLAGISFPADA